MCDKTQEVLTTACGQYQGSILRSLAVYVRKRKGKNAGDLLSCCRGRSFVFLNASRNLSIKHEKRKISQWTE